ncbi:MAG TPA: type II secretion system protein [Kofleriaceae bacterium]|nr:type II secretion system protein [Kofleriaceae bacterium]
MRNPRGMTILELMIVLAIIGAGMFLARSGFRMLTKADLVENSTELAAVLKRTGQLAVEKGEMHRVIIDTDKQIYAVEMCQGERTISRNEAVRPDEEATKRALEKGKERLKDVPADGMTSDPEAATKQALSIAGHHIADKMCSPVDDPSSDAEGKGWVRTLKANKGVKFKEIWVQHRDESTSKGQVAIYFFPTGSAEKAVVEITDGSETFSVLVSGLTGRVELRDGVLSDVNDHMMRNALGDKDKPREDER